MKCVGSPCRIIYTVCGKPPVSLLKLFNYNKEFRVVAQTHAQTGDCLSVQYRENALIIEVRTIQNLGKRTQKECLKEKFFRQSEHSVNVKIDK